MSVSTLDMSSIDFGNCEYELRKKYNIDKNYSLLVVEVKYFPDNSKIPMIGYEVRHPTNYSILNLSYCNNSEVTLSISVSIDENSLFLYDPNSEYYTDDCNSFTTENGTDIILKDRQKEFVDKNLSLCEKKCKYLGYSISSKQSSCSCEIKNEMEKISELMNKPDKLSNEFSSKKNSDSLKNIMSIKCTSVLFSKEGLIRNISSYSLSVIYLYYLCSIIIFIKCGFKILIMKIENIISDKKKSDKDKKNKQKIDNKSVKKTDSNNFNQQKKNSIKPISDKNKNKRYHRVLRSSFISKNPTTKLSLGGESQNNRRKSAIKIGNIISIAKKNNNKTFFSKNYFNDYELNTLSYNDAHIYDKRSCCAYYNSLLKAKHPILFGFCPFNDNNSIIIKSCIFLLIFNINYFINFLFFNDNSIHQIYEDGGSYNIFYFLPQISISFALSNIIIIIIKYIFLSESNIKEIKIQKTFEEANNIFDKIKNQLIRKYILFYILSLIFIFVFWFFLSEFGAVYKNTQVILFINTLISLAISFIYPFIINIIPCFFRFYSLSDKKKQSQCMYTLSKFFQLL